MRAAGYFTMSVCPLEFNAENYLMKRDV